MKANLFLKSNTRFAKKIVFPFQKENRAILTQFIIGLFFIGMAIWFLKHEQTELSQIKGSITNASWQWVLLGIAITILYFVLQGLMYVASFASVNAQISLKDAIILFLKRNFISVFIPAGGFSSLAFFTKNLEKKGNNKTQIHLASSVYGFIGILSVVIIAIPVFIYAFIKSTINSSEWISLALIVFFLVLIIVVYKSVLKKDFVYKYLIKWFPKLETFVTTMETYSIDRKIFLKAVFYSVLIEVVGISHLYVAMLALHFQPTLLVASIGYIVSVLFLIMSPFMRGLGAIEISMTFVLIQYGFNNAAAVSVTLLYRLFEFWTPLLAGILTFLSKINKLLLRIIPALLIFILGTVNIVSVLTPAIHSRLLSLENYLPLEAVNASNYMVFAAGLFLLATASFMLKGFRMAWWFAIALSTISFIGNLTKAIDYEEATIAIVVILILIATRKEYFIKANLKLRLLGLETAFLSIIAVLLYGIIGFYFLDKKHFGIDFTTLQSLRYTLQNYFLVGSSNLIPLDSFANNFLISIKISGFISFAFLIYTLIKPFVLKNTISVEEKELANELVKQYGHSALDYFKTYHDKMLFISENKKSFLAYRLAGNYAVVLENPVAETKLEMKECIIAFDKFCYASGLENIYYRVAETDLEIYKSLGKKSFFLGQEGVVDLTNFNLEGGSKKPLRNAINKIVDSGLKAVINHPPIKDGLLQRLEAVSEQWLEETERTEIIFSQGMFLWDELKNQTIITVENKEEKIIAFLNIIPDYANGEATYDLIRKTNDAPNGIMDFILVALFNYLKSENYTSVNLGLAPMSGIVNPVTIQEKSMKFAYEKIKSFSHYKGLRAFKEKFTPTWSNQYIVFSDDYDLIQIPRILSKVIKP